MSSIEDVCETVNALAAAQQTEVQPAAAAAFEVGKQIEAVNGDNPLVTKVEEALSALFDSMRGNVHTATAASGQILPVALEVQQQYSDVTDSSAFAVATSSLARLGREMHAAAATADEVIYDEHKLMLSVLYSGLSKLTLHGTRIAGVATDAHEQSQAIVALSQAYNDRLRSR
jgi:hypothetical protein